MQYTTEQESFWAGEFGDRYIHRNNTDHLLYSKIAMWTRVLKSANNVNSATEFGCNIGLNLLALKSIKPTLTLSGYEINQTAANQAIGLNIATITCDTILKDIVASPVDLTFTAGVLIHIDPQHLDKVYKNLVYGSKRYIVVAEYYNPTPVTVTYHNQQDKLFKRDFAGELIETYDLNLVDYGFIYKRDNWSPQDDITWFLLEKKL